MLRFAQTTVATVGKSDLSYYPRLVLRGTSLVTLNDDSLRLHLYVFGIRSRFPPCGAVTHVGHDVLFIPTEISHSSPSSIICISIFANQHIIPICFLRFNTMSSTTPLSTCTETPTKQDPSDSEPHEINEGQDSKGKNGSDVASEATYHVGQVPVPSIGRIVSTLKPLS